MTKTEEMIKYFKSEEYKTAFKITKKFWMSLTKEELKTINRVYEMYNNERFYNSLGFKFDEELKKAKRIIKSKYNI